MPNGMTLWVIALFVVGASSAALPNIVDLPVGAWTDLVPESTYATCMTGSNYSFMVKPSAGDPNRENILVYFAGGGMCSSVESCSGLVVDEFSCINMGAVPTVLSYGPTSPALTKMTSGIMNDTDANNPLKDYTRVWVSYCSGDLGWGNSTAPYPAVPVFRHLGALQIGAVVDWMSSQNLSPKHVVVSGYSAGAFTSVAWAPAFRSLYPAARVDVVSDAGLSASTSVLDFVRDALGVWGAANDFLPAPTRSVIDQAMTTNVMPLEEMIKGLLGSGVRVATATAVEDVTMIAFFRFSGTQAAPAQTLTAAQWRLATAEEVERLSALSTNYSAFVFHGFRHGHLCYPELHTVTSNGVTMVTWLSDFLAGNGTTLQCEGCTAAELTLDNQGSCTASAAADQCGMAAVAAGANNTCSCSASCETEGGCCGDFIEVCFPATDATCITGTCYTTFGTVVESVKTSPLVPADMVDGLAMACDGIAAVVTGLNDWTVAAAVSNPPLTMTTGLMAQTGGCQNPCMFPVMEQMKTQQGCPNAARYWPDVLSIYDGWACTAPAPPTTPAPTTPATPDATPAPPAGDLTHEVQLQVSMPYSLADFEANKPKITAAFAAAANVHESQVSMTAEEKDARRRLLAAVDVEVTIKTASKAAADTVAGALTEEALNTELADQGLQALSAFQAPAVVEIEDSSAPAPLPSVASALAAALALLSLAAW